MVGIPLLPAVAAVHSCLPSARCPQECQIAFQVVNVEILDQGYLVSRRKVALTPEVSERIIHRDIVVKCNRDTSTV
jgi:hypothetical protein